MTTEETKQTLTDRMTNIIRWATNIIRWMIQNIGLLCIRLLFFPVWICAALHDRSTTEENIDFWGKTAEIVIMVWLVILCGFVIFLIGYGIHLLDSPSPSLSDVDSSISAIEGAFE